MRSQAGDDLVHHAPLPCAPLRVADDDVSNPFRNDLYVTVAAKILFSR